MNFIKLIISVWIIWILLRTNRKTETVIVIILEGIQLNSEN